MGVRAGVPISTKSPNIDCATREETVRDGEIVAANVEGYGVIIRQYTLDFSEVTLTSFDKETSLKVPRTTVEIQGVVVGIWRKNY